MFGGEMPGDRTSQTELRKDKLVSVDSTETDTDTDGYILLGIMGVIIMGGLTIAIKYKRRA